MEPATFKRIYATFHRHRESKGAGTDDLEDMMAVLATLFFATTFAAALYALVAMLVVNATAIGRALRMETPADVLVVSAARVTRVRRSIRPRSAVASAQWRAAA